MASMTTVLNFALLKLAGLLSEVFLVLAASGVGQLKFLVWKFHKGEKGYGFLLFWRTEEEPKNEDTTLKKNNNNSPQQECVNYNHPSKRKQ